MEPISKYQNGKIYTLRSNTTERFYIGSTYNDLAKRKAEHKRHKKNAISKLDDFYIELLENFPCENKDELRKREGEHIREHRDVCVNILIAGRTYKEWIDDNKEIIAEKAKVYREENKEVLAEKKKAWNEANKEVIAEQHKVYKKANRDKINACQRARRASKKALE